jgi:hypothetical protein
MWRCDDCKHEREEHFADRGRCKVVGCECEAHVEYDYSDEAPSEGLSVAEMLHREEIARRLK